MNLVLRPVVYLKFLPWYLPCQGVTRSEATTLSAWGYDLGSQLNSAWVGHRQDIYRLHYNVALVASDEISLHWHSVCNPAPPH